MIGLLIRVRVMRGNDLERWLCPTCNTSNPTSTMRCRGCRATAKELVTA